MKRGLNVKSIIFLSLFFVSFVLLINNIYAIEDPVGRSCPVAGDSPCPLPSSSCWHKCIQLEGHNSCEDDSCIWGACSTSTAVSENTQTLCSNKQDDDCDGLVDCADLDSCGGINKDTDGDTKCDGLDDDVDGDGVLNDADLEDDTDFGCVVDNDGIKRDQDGDEICDNKDKCAFTETGCEVAGYEIGNHAGCPVNCATCPQDRSCRACALCETSWWDWDFCFVDECLAIGSEQGIGCYFDDTSIGGVIGYGACSACNLKIEPNSDCSIYVDEESCVSNQCLSQEDYQCEWISGECETKDKNNYYKDDDGDGFGNAGSGTISTYKELNQLEGYVNNNEDCDDTDQNINSDGIELCDNVDNNCDDKIDQEEPGVICECKEGDAPEKCPIIESVCLRRCNANTGEFGSCDYDSSEDENTLSACNNNVDDDCDGLVDCADPDCGGNGQEGSGNCDNDRVCDRFETDRDNDGINDLDGQGNSLDREICTSQNCRVDPLGNKIDTDNDGVCDRFGNKGTDDCLGTTCPYIDESGCPAEGMCELGVCYNDPACQSQRSTCESCGDGTVNLCDRNECLSIDAYIQDKCYFVSTIGNYGACNNCDAGVSCSNYDPDGCTRDPCNLGCEWDSENGECEGIQKTSFYPDNDGDGFGDEDSEPTRAVSEPEGYVANNLDCDDSDTDNRNDPGVSFVCPTSPSGCSIDTRLCAICISPGASEICKDGINNNCDEQTDERCECDLTNKISGTDLIDQDGDGVPDTFPDNELCTLSRCQSLMDPDVPGKALDRDIDGVCDAVDKCWQTSATCAPYVIKIVNDPKEGCPPDTIRNICSDDPYFRLAGNIKDCRIEDRDNGQALCSDYGANDDYCMSDPCKVGNCRFVDGECTGKLIYYKDKDGDGVPGDYGSSSNQNERRELNIGETIPEDFHNAGEVTIFDCGDNDISVYPEATEICNNDRDDNCNGLEDEAGCSETSDGGGGSCGTPGLIEQHQKYGDEKSGCKGAFRKCNQDRILSPWTYDANIYEETEVSCRNNIDNDCDGLKDCEDSDCGNQIYCKVKTLFGIDCDYENDNDCDGVRNIDDEEPSTPVECKANNAGFAIDNDNDEVCDSKKDSTVMDQCPNTPNGCEVITTYGARRAGCPTTDECSDSNCAKADQRCEGVTPSPGPDGQCSCRLEVDTSSCTGFTGGTTPSGSENGVVLSCSAAEDGLPRIPVGIKIIDFNDPLALKDHPEKYMINCCKLRCATA